MARRTTSVPVLQNAGPDGEPTPVPIPKQNGRTAEEMGVPAAPKPLTIKQRLGKLTKFQSLIVGAESRIVATQLQIGEWLAQSEPMFWFDGKPGKLTFVVPADGKLQSGETVEVEYSFNEWATILCKLPYSSLREYVQAGRFALAHPEIKSKSERIRTLALLDGAASRKPESVTALLEAIPAGATAEVVETVIGKIAPKPVPKPKRQDTSKMQSGLESKIRDKVWSRLALKGAGMSPDQLVAMQEYAVWVAQIATDGKLKNLGLLPASLKRLHKEYNGNLSEASK